MRAKSHKHCNTALRYTNSNKEPLHSVANRKNRFTFKLNLSQRYSIIDTKCNYFNYFCWDNENHGFELMQHNMAWEMNHFKRAKRMQVNLHMVTIS